MHFHKNFVTKIEAQIFVKYTLWSNAYLFIFVTTKISWNQNLKPASKGHGTVIEYTILIICIVYFSLSNDPDFTPCFHKTVLVYIPCGFLWIFAFFDQIMNWKSKKRNCPWSWNNISKLFLTSVLIALSSIEVILLIILALKNEHVLITGIFLMFRKT